MVLPLILDSQNFGIHQRNLYRISCRSGSDAGPSPLPRAGTPGLVRPQLKRVFVRTLEALHILDEGELRWDAEPAVIKVLFYDLPQPFMTFQNPS